MDLKSNLTLIEAQKRASIFLEENGFDGHLARYYWLSLFDWSLTDYILKLHQPISKQEEALYQSALNRIIQFEPIQYITGSAEFMNEKFKVTTDTLIPREDTAGLVELAADYLKSQPTASVLDIGTGTGIIPIMLAKIYPTANIVACDISPQALKVADFNRAQHNVSIELLESDLFEQVPLENKFDLILSNPPYIAEDEMKWMDESVKKFEPISALYAENNGLAIYQRLAVECQPFVHNTSLIILEVGFRQAETVKQIFKEQFPHADITIHQDLNQHNRYVRIQL